MRCSTTRPSFVSKNVPTDKKAVLLQMHISTRSSFVSTNEPEKAVFSRYIFLNYATFFCFNKCVHNRKGSSFTDAFLYYAIFFCFRCVLTLGIAIWYVYKYFFLWHNSSIKILSVIEDVCVDFMTRKVFFFFFYRWNK